MSRIARSNLAIVLLILFGLAAVTMGIRIGEADDAPGAGVLGILIFLGTVIGSVMIVRKRRSRLR